MFYSPCRYRFLLETMKAKSGLVYGLILALFLLAVGSRRGEVLYLTIPCLVYVGIGLFFAPQNPVFKVERTLSLNRCQPGTEVEMTITINNRGGRVFRAAIKDRVPPGLTIETGETASTVLLRAGESIYLHYRFTAPRGVYSWEKIQIITSDPFGLFNTTIDESAEGQLLVLPEAKQLKPIRYRPQFTLSTPGSNLAGKAGSGHDFWGVREYQPGDSLRSINWRMMAKNPRFLFSKEFEREEMADIGLILDGRFAGGIENGEPENRSFSASVQAAASIAKTLIRAGNRVSLMTIGDRIQRVFPGYGRVQMGRILDVLAAAKPAGALTVNPLLHLPLRMFPRKSLVILISSLLENDLPSIKRLKAEGYQVVVLSPNPFTGLNEDDVFHEFALRAVRLERAVFIRSVRSLGIPVLGWDPEESLDQVFRTAGLNRIRVR